MHLGRPQSPSPTTTNDQEGEQMAMFGMLAVDEKHERKGLAGWLIREAEARATAAGCATMAMHFPAVREDMARYYTKLGYVYGARFLGCEPIERVCKSKSITRVLI
jgi:GNAT superfamily N-acetyltransferase